MHALAVYLNVGGPFLHVHLPLNTRLFNWLFYLVNDSFFLFQSQLKLFDVVSFNIDKTLSINPSLFLFSET